MATELGMKFTIAGDVQGLISAITKGQKSINDFEAQAKRFQEKLKEATDPKDIVRLNNALAATKERLKLLQGGAQSVKQPMQGINESSNKATFALTNLSRVAQDAPFGFIGIANNIEPLLTSFQQLTKESGGVKGALSALGSSLLGGGGLILAFSAFQFFALGGVDAVKKMFGALGDNAAIKKAKEEMEKFNKELDNAKSNAISTGLQLQNFASIAGDSTRPLNERNYALDQANKLLGTHGEKLTLVTANSKAAREQIDLYTKALIQQAVASKAADKAADLIILQAQATKDYANARNEAIAAEKDYTNSIARQQQVGGFARGAVNVQEQKDLTTAIKKKAEAATTYKQITKELTDVLNIFGSSNAQAAKLFAELGTNTAKAGKGEKDVLSELEKKLNEISGLFGAGLIDKTEFNKQFISAYKDAIGEIAKINPNSKNIEGLRVKVFPVLLATEMKDLGDKLVKEDTALEVPVEFVPPKEGDPKLAALGEQVRRRLLEAAARNAQVQIPEGIENASDAKLEETIANRQKMLEDYAGAASQLLAQPFNTLFETIASGGENAFAAFGEALKKIIVRMAAAAATAFILSNILAPFLGAAGASAETLKKFSFKSLFGGMLGIPGLATGGYVSGKGTGTSDSILARLSNGEFVINAKTVNRIGRNNLEKLNSGGNIGGGMAVSVNVGGSLRGKTILFAQQAASKQIERNG